MDVLTLGNHEFEGENNAYLLRGGGRVTLVDTGVATPAIREEFTDRLAEHGLSMADIDQVYLTHWHPDHSGLAAEIQAAGGASIAVHEADAPLVRRDPAAVDGLHARQFEQFEAWGMPAERRETLRPNLYIDGIVGRPESVDTFADGDGLDAGELELEVIHALGHAAGLSCLAFDGTDGPEAFVGDAVLPRYTPNVGGADVRVDEPLTRYLETLRRIVDRDFVRVWPGHRDVIEAPSERAETIIEHHQDRSRRILEVLESAGPADAWTVSAHLFGELEGIHILHGPGEAYAHLDHLERHGLVEHTPEGYTLDGHGDAAAHAETLEKVV